ncbi:MAG: ATP-dependent helicase [Lachnospiraceae bacterium]|nr:ATP-dependent helicase [Lachnospiraceae bacterium]
MALQLWMGPSGSGKTTSLYEWLIREAERSSAFQALLIVPEQFTMQTQKDLVSLHPRHSVANIDILSFDRLAYRVLGEQGAENLTVLDDMGKLLVLRRAASLCGKELTLFRKNLDKAGFIDKIKSMLSELYQYRIDEGQLRELIAATGGQPLLKRKLEEILTLYTAFDHSMQEDTIPSERLLDVLCRLIPDSGLIRASAVAFDGFTGFTPAQYQVLEALMRHAKQVIVTAPTDEDLQEPLFEMGRTMVRTLRTLAAKGGIAEEESRLLPPGLRFQESPALAVLERQFLRCPAMPMTEKDDSGSLRLWEVTDRRAELQCVAREMFRLVKEEGMRYRDMAVVSSDIAGYEPVIRQVFGRYGIPCFIDIKKSMMGHPLVAYLRGALETIESGYSYETMFACLKSGMAPLEEQDLYELENYVLAKGLRGRRAWETPWEQADKEDRRTDMERLNRIRRQAAEPLLALHKALKSPGASVQDYAAALVEFMQGQQVEKRLKQLAERLLQAGEASLSLEYEQAYKKVLELLDKIVELFGDARVSLREWREILDTGFSEIRVGVIPACVDRVVAGDMHRTRLKDPKVLFFVGANDGLVPKTGEKASLLSDLDRRSLSRLGVSLAPTRQQNGFIDRFYLYLTLTKPSRRLYVSWCRQSLDGGALSPSYMVGELKNVFPWLTAEQADRGMPLAEQIVTRKTAGDALLAGFADYKEGRACEAWKELYSLFWQDPQGQKELARWRDAAFMTYREESLGPAVARALYGEQVGGSVTRLERYAACAYGQFLSYGLELAERKLHEFAAADMGTLFHEVIRRFFAKVYGEDSQKSRDQEEMRPEPAVIGEERRKALVHQCLLEAAAQGGSRGLEGTARGDYLLRRVERIADRTLWALCEQLARGDFRPSEVEVEFDGRDSQAMNLLIDADTLMRLHGRIDRVDTCEDGDEIYVKVIDYKTGGTSFDLVGVYYGLQLQLAVYLDAAMERERRKHGDKTVIPAGILYYNIHDPFVQTGPEEAAHPDPASVETALLKELKMNGLVNREREIYRRLDRLVGTDAPPVIPVVEKDGEPVEKRSSLAGTRQLEALCRFVRGRMQEFGRRIMEGDLAVNPYIRDGHTGCDYCRFAAVCGFDKKTPGYEYRRLGEPAVSEIWEEVEHGGNMDRRTEESD